jgi:hypothetical protein
LAQRARLKAQDLTKVIFRCCPDKTGSAGINKKILKTVLQADAHLQKLNRVITNE